MEAFFASVEQRDKHEFFGRTITLKVKYADFEQITRSKTPGGFISESGMFWQVAQELLSTVDYSEKKIRLMGLTVSNAQDLDRPEVYQLELEFWEIGAVSGKHGESPSWMVKS